MAERSARCPPVSVKVRPGRPADAELLLAIDDLVNVSPWSLSQLQATCNSAAESAESILVLERKGRVCGFIIFSQVLDEVCIHNLAVHRAQQGDGLGRSLVVAALELARQHGARHCLLEVRGSNAAARGLYEALNFQLDGIRRNYYPTPTGREDALLMSRKL